MFGITNTMDTWTLSSHEPSLETRSDLHERARNPTLSPSDICNLLSHKYRRYVLYHVSQAPNPVSLEELTAQLTRWLSPGTVTEADLEAVLEDTHLPMLASAGVIGFDHVDGSIELKETAMVLVPYLELTMEADFA